MKLRHGKLRISTLAAAALLGGTVLAEAKPARCFSSDDGTYECNFRALDRQGSFEIAAKGKPTFTLWVDTPGIAAGFINFGDRNISLPGQYVRETQDPACWRSDATEARICAW